MNSVTNQRPSVLRTELVGGMVCIVAAASGYFASRHAPYEVLSALLKYAMGIIGVVWFFSLVVYNKLSDVTDISGLDYRQHRNVENEIRARLHWFWLRAIFLALLGLGMYAPIILAEAKLAIPSWMFGGAFGCLALALYSLRRLWAELEDIRELKSYVKEIERREKERAEQVKNLKDDLKGDWKPDPKLDGFRKNSNNNTP